jgi:hypothetical protein
MSSLPPGSLPEGSLPDGTLPAVDESAASIDVRQRFTVITFPFWPADATDFRSFGPAVKDPAESLHVELDLFAWCANYWRPNEQIAITEYVLSRRLNGFSYRVSVAGATGMREPEFWPRLAGATVQSGSATLVAVAGYVNALMPISDVSGASDPSGLTLSGVAVSETAKILATYAGGDLDRDYDAVFSFTLNGAQRVARQKVMVRKR